MNIKNCPNCGSSKIQKVCRTVTYFFNNEEYLVPDLEFLECHGCNEKFYTPQSMKKIEQYSPAFARKQVVKR